MEQQQEVNWDTVKRHKQANFFCDTKTRSFIGRDGKSWALITIFYFIFYLVLGGLYCLFVFVLSQFIGKNEPKLIGSASILAGGLYGYTGETEPYPGLAYRPSGLDFKDGKDVFKFSTDDIETLRPFSDSLDFYLDGLDKLAKKDKIIDFAREIGCYNQTNTLEPCFLVKLNKVYGWVPMPFNPEKLAHSKTKLPYEAPEKKKLSVFHLKMDNSQFSILSRKNILIACEERFVQKGDDKEIAKVGQRLIGTKFYSLNDTEPSNFGKIPFSVFPLQNLKKNFDLKPIFLKLQLSNDTTRYRKKLPVTVICSPYAENLYAGESKMKKHYDLRMPEKVASSAKLVWDSYSFTLSINAATSNRVELMKNVLLYIPIILSIFYVY
ncbi:hypothetical protein SNEBB_000648 [Seison nebaliae]|nr:hypothetical protein SNEBB_000648 [Seison nebaliae]